MGWSDKAAETESTSSDDIGETRTNKYIVFARTDKDGPHGDIWADGKKLFVNKIILPPQFHAPQLPISKEHRRSRAVWQHFPDTGDHRLPTDRLRRPAMKSARLSPTDEAELRKALSLAINISNHVGMLGKPDLPVENSYFNEHNFLLREGAEKHLSVLEAAKLEGTEMLPLTRGLAQDCSKALAIIGRSFDSHQLPIAAAEGRALSQKMRADIVRARFVLGNHWYPHLSTSAEQRPDESDK